MLHQHPAVLSAAVVAKPDDKWGEVPCAFVELRAGAGPITEDEADCVLSRPARAASSAPREVRFITLPKTATGKIQKFRLREMAGSREAITQAGSGDELSVDRRNHGRRRDIPGADSR